MTDISYKDFTKLDIRIGTVVKAEVPKWSHWVMKLTVDFGGGIASAAKSAKDRSSRRVRVEPKSREARSGGGDEIGKRIIFAGTMKFFKPEELEGKQFPFVVNMEPKKIGPKGDYSEGMMLAVSARAEKPIIIDGEEVDEKPILLVPSEKVNPGAKVR